MIHNYNKGLTCEGRTEFYFKIVKPSRKKNLTQTQFVGIKRRKKIDICVF